LKHPQLWCHVGHIKQSEAVVAVLAEAPAMMAKEVRREGTMVAE